MNIIRFCLLLICLNFLIGCGQVNVNDTFKERLNNTVFFDTSKSKLSEVTTPLTIKQLNQNLEKYTPQVQIITPQAEQVLAKTDVAVKLKVKDLPIFQDQKLKLGNHLDLILDNEVSRPIYDLEQPIVLNNLSPGTHCLRVFASRPWGESFKNDEAYAQITFSVLTETNDNRPDPSLPLLTYSQPSRMSAGEPFLLDFYLTNAPLHAVAKSNSQLKDWRVKATVNGDSFLLEDWQPVYLTGFNQGDNWIQLELIDDQGNDIENNFNNTVRVINYDPQQTDTISELFADKISLAEAHSLIEQDHDDQSSEISQPVESKVELEKELNIERIVNPALTEDISKSTSDNLRQDDIQDKTKQSISKEVSEKNLKTSEENSVIAELEETQVNLAEENKQELLTEQTNASAKTNPVQNSSTSSSSESPIINSSISNKSDPQVSDIQKEELENKQPETNLVKSAKSEQIIPTETINTDVSQSGVKNTIPQSESTELNETEITIDLASKDLNLEQIEENSAPVWWKKILVELRQKLDSLVKRLPTEI